MTPTTRTLNALRADGWTVQVVESWIPGANIRRDLWGIGDVLGMKIGAPLLLVQCTSAPNMAARIAKAKSEIRLRTWLACGHRFEVWGWQQIDSRWTCRKATVEHVSTADELIVTRPPRRKRKRQEPCLFPCG